MRYRGLVGKAADTMIRQERKNQTMPRLISDVVRPSADAEIPRQKAVRGREANANLLSIFADVFKEVGDVLAQLRGHVLGTLLRVTCQALCVTCKALDGTKSLVNCCAGLGQVAKGVILTNVLYVAALGLQSSGSVSIAAGPKLHLRSKHVLTHGHGSGQYIQHEQSRIGAPNTCSAQWNRAAA